MKVEDFIIFGKYILNRVNRDEFDKIFTKILSYEPHKSYLNLKWNEFCTNQLSFLVCYQDFTNECIKLIDKTNYNG